MSSSRPSTATNDDPSKKQRLQQLREAEEQKRRQKNAKLGMMGTTSAAGVAPRVNRPQSAVGTPPSISTATQKVSAASVPLSPRGKDVPVSSITLSDTSTHGPLVISVESTTASQTSSQSQQQQQRPHAAPGSHSAVSPAAAVTTIQVKSVADTTPQLAHDNFSHSSALSSADSTEHQQTATTPSHAGSFANSSASVQPQLDSGSASALSEVQSGDNGSVHPQSQPPPQQQQAQPAASPSLPAPRQPLAAVYDPTVDTRTPRDAGAEQDSQVTPAPVGPTTTGRMDPTVFSAEEFQDLAKFVAKFIPQGKRMQCRIVRRQDGVEKLYPHYDFYLQQGIDQIFLMSARKRKKSRYANYIISTSNSAAPKKKEGMVGKVRSNFLGTEFAAYDAGYNPAKGGPKEGQSTEARRELATVTYDPNLLGFKGPRKMTVLIPRITKSGPPVNIQPNNVLFSHGKFRLHDSALERYRRNDFRDILVLQNKSPQWNEDTQSYVLNFNGRVTLASVKNFQIVHESDLDYIVLQFGRVGEDAFTVDLQYPLCPLQAFAIALTSFDAKLACE